MGKVLNFFTRIDPEDPLLGGCFPIKHIVAVFQIYSIGYLIALSLRDLCFYHGIVTGFMFFFLTISFFGYVYENELVMELHLLGSTIIFCWSVLTFILGSILLILLAPDAMMTAKEMEMNSTSISNDTALQGVMINDLPFIIENVYLAEPYYNFVVKTILFVLKSIADILQDVIYLWMCNQLVEAAHRKNSTLGSINKMFVDDLPKTTPRF